MQYGYFDHEKKEYVITNLFTPTKWINYIGTLNFGGFVDHTGGALLCKGDPALNRITKYIPQLPASDFKGTTLYLRYANAQGYDVFSPFFSPTLKELDHYECHVGLGYTTINSTYKGIHTEVTIFVPTGKEVEIRIIKVTNNTEHPVSVDAIPVVEYTHFDALKQYTNADWVPQTMQSRAILDEEGLLVLRQYAFMRKDTHINYFTANLPHHSFETDRKIFLGANEYGGWGNPLSLQNESLSNSEAHRGDNIAAILYPLGSLDPGETKVLITQLGQTPNVSLVSEQIVHFRKLEKVEAELQKMAAFWTEYLSHFQTQTPDAAFNALVNVHNARQCYITKNWSRYLSLYQLGLGARGLGVRDSSQDILGVIHAIPVEAKELIKKLISVQSIHGYAYHQFYPLTMEANMGDAREMEDRPQYYSDDFMWTIQAITAYIKETGDLKFLDEIIPFYEKDKAGHPMESATVREHIDRAIHFTKNDLGPHGLCHLGFADWMDPMNLPTGAESAFTTCLLGVAMQERINLAEHENDTATVEMLTTDYLNLKKNFNEVAWTGEWYLSYFNHKGEPLGSPESSSGKIFSFGQTWPILAGFAEGGRAKKALESVKKYLSTEHGIKVSTPGFNGYDPNVGGISTYPPGAKENCGIFMHTNPWVIICETLAGNPQQAYEYHANTNPAAKNDIIDIYELEPYVYAQNILGDEHPQFGLARNSWLSGTAAWMYVAATQYLLGIQPTLEGLRIDPHLPHDWGQVSVSRKFRGAVYHISIRQNQMQQGIIVDGENIKGNVIPPLKNGQHDVLVYLD
jgi:cellobiose phosphorylase